MSDNRSPLANLMAKAEAVKGRRFDERDLVGGAPDRKRRRHTTRGKALVQMDLSESVRPALAAIARQLGTSTSSVAEWLMRHAIEVATIDDLAADLVPSSAPNYALWLPPSEVDQSALQRFCHADGSGVEKTKTEAAKRTP
jgi:hypothetical protein